MSFIHKSFPLFPDGRFHRRPPNQDDQSIAKEQSILRDQITETHLLLKTTLKQCSKIQFVSSVIELPERTPELLRVFIRRIEIMEKEETYSRACGNELFIRCTFEVPKDTLDAIISKAAA